jgi:hypothetical protein
MKDCECGLIPVVMEDGDTYKVVCPKCSLGTNMKSTSDSAVGAWDGGEIYEVGFDLLTREDKR